MTRDDAIAKLRGSLLHLRETGVTGLSLVGSSSNESEAWDEVDVVLDINLAANLKFSMWMLGGIKNDLEDELGITVWPLVLDGMEESYRARLARDLVRIV